jgi:hypothetical protein
MRFGLEVGVKILNNIYWSLCYGSVRFGDFAKG